MNVARVAASTALLAKKKGRGGGNNEGAQPRERKEKDDVIEVCRKIDACLLEGVRERVLVTCFIAVAVVALRFRHLHNRRRITRKNLA